jgi:putative membrane protein
MLPAALMNAIGQLVDALTGLERILATPIPFSYSVHLWITVCIYCLLLPFQIWTALRWLTIPGTAILSFMFFGFLVAGEEIENPFGYDKNGAQPPSRPRCTPLTVWPRADLNMDHFCSNIVRSELAAITSTPAPAVGTWAFAPSNDRVFTSCGVRGGHDPTHDTPAPPEEWVRRGEGRMREALAMW